jgi:hypothetical protein
VINPVTRFKNPIAAKINANMKYIAIPRTSILPAMIIVCHAAMKNMIKITKRPVTRLIQRQLRSYLA